MQARGKRREEAARSSKSEQRLRSARREMYRQLILESAEAVFAVRGFAETRMSEVAREAGISLKTLYATFSGKQELFEAIQALRCEELFAAMAAITEGSALEVTMERVRVGVEHLIAHPDFLRIHLREGNAWAAGPSKELGGDPNLWQESLRLQADILQRGSREGIFVDEDPERMAKMMTALYQVQLADWLERGGDEAPAELVARIQRHTRHLLAPTSPL